MPRTFHWWSWAAEKAKSSGLLTTTIITCSIISFISMGINMNPRWPPGSSTGQAPHLPSSSGKTPPESWTCSLDLILGPESWTLYNVHWSWILDLNLEPGSWTWILDLHLGPCTLGLANLIQDTPAKPNAVKKIRRTSWQEKIYFASKTHMGVYWLATWTMSVLSRSRQAVSIVHQR